MIFYFVRGHVGPLHKIQGYQRHRNVRKCRPHHIGDICTTRGNNLKTSFSYMSQNEQIFFFYYLGGGGVLVGPLCRTQVNENFRAVRPHHRADVCIARQITTSFSYLGHNSTFFYSTLVTSDILGPVKIEKFHCHLAGGANKM